MEQILRSPEEDGAIDIQQVIEGLATLQAKELSYDEFVEGQALADEMLILLKEANN